MHALRVLASTPRVAVPSLLVLSLTAPLRAEPPARPAVMHQEVSADADHPVGTARVVVPARNGRQLPVQLWYPAVDAAREEAAAGHPAAHFEPAGPLRDKFQRLLDTGRKECLNQTMHAAIDATPRPSDAPLPLVIISHHMGGSRVSTFSINEALARRGFVVAGIDHVGGTVFDLSPTDLIALATAVSVQTVRTRANDLASVLDVLLDPSSTSVPEGLRGRIDPARVGSYGHSMGGFAVALNQVEDARVKASAYLATVPAGGLPSLAVQAPAINRLRAPGLFFVAQEDAVVALLGGSKAIREGFEKQKPPASLVEVRDLGHFAIADDLDIQGMGDGCGSAPRVDRPRERYTNPPPAVAREIASRYVTAFFAHQLLGASDAPLRAAEPAASVITRSRP